MPNDTQTVQETQVSPIVKYGNLVEFDIFQIPSVSLLSFVKKGVGHVFGNEVAAKVSAAKAARKEAGEPELTEAEIEETKAKFTQEYLDAMWAGTMGHRVGGPRGPRLAPMAAEIQSQAIAKATTLLRALGLTMPTKGKTVTFGNGQELTKEDLIARVMAKYGPELEREAKRVVDRRNKDMEKAKAAAAEGQSLEDFGF